MTELNCEENKSEKYSVGNERVTKAVLIYGLLVVGFGTILNSEVLFGYFSLLTDTVQPVISNMVSHCPVEVKLPAIPMGPTWNGSSGNI
ncbi:hypothetical protein [Yersinia aleksiciae]|uniref:Uncharacterized protein n=1 Tax=Yersinia aleksiciae TaxID=263819 RepID=A0A0T9UX11_YERAE|nr:hypothetical protein [Yersinia aleksiciae]AKP34350.1 hypothetical protein ACZ76_12780 [Yersinia aleksiciae]MDA5497756.1 nuclease [Yersinia aleksiciae]NIL00800.1 nuclease [Yersinia aleksiciae]WQC70077.1 nuclease [Yersinia aleksiciae]CFQ55611.1 Uncharacterised protein [Yersinia aleksiciae]